MYVYHYFCRSHENVSRSGILGDLASLIYRVITIKILLRRNKLKTWFM